jgi:hypothetical protein
MHGKEDLAGRADAIRKREFDGGGAEDAGGEVEVKVDAEHDGPWMSCMSKDGGTMYRNKNVPAKAEINGKTVDVDARLKAHETAEWKELHELLAGHKAVDREPDDEERKKIYESAHRRRGVPAERALVAAEDGDGGKAWNAWCRGMEAKVEKGPFTNEPEDADVKPIPHTHNDLEAADVASDSAPPLALDKDSVRKPKKDGQMEVEVSNISKACVNPYRGEEIPGWQDLGLDPNKVYKLLRDPKELEKGASTFNGVQLMQRHIPVSADDHQPWDVIGTMGSEARYEHPYLKNSMYVWVKDAIDDIESGRKKELSSGYHYKPIMEPGEYEGEPYDGRMTDIVGNHVALVRDGRAGDDVVVADSFEDMQWAAIEQALLSMHDA